MRLPESIKPLVRALARRLGVEIIRARSDVWLRDLPIRTVIDVGANIGQFARTARRLFPQSQIYSFEPLAVCFDELTRTFARDARFRAFQCALGAREEMLTLHKSDYRQASSFLAISDLHTGAFPETVSKFDETVRVRRLDDVLNDRLAPDVLLKLDVQGFETEVLDGGPQVLSETRVVITEVSFMAMYDTQPLFDEIYGRLVTAGFRFHGVLDQLPDPRDGRILQADALFLRGATATATD